MASIPTITLILIVIIGIIHVGFAIGEIFFTALLLARLLKFPEAPEEPKELKEIFIKATSITQSIAQNAGIYNSFIAAGLFWSAFDTTNPMALRIFFLVCVVVAGIFGAITLKTRNTLFLQTIPAIVALVLVWINKP